MYEQQLDLFSSAGIQAERPLPQSMELRPTAAALDDQALIAAIPESNLAGGIALARQAGGDWQPPFPALRCYVDGFPVLALTAWCRSRPPRFKRSLRSAVARQHRRYHS